MAEEETSGRTAGETTDGGSSAQEPCDHDWTLVNRDESRLVYKCLRCGALRSE